MLILTRKMGESLMIGDDVTISVLGVKGNQVRIGIDAPKHIQVHREEIYNRIQNEKLETGSEDHERGTEDHERGTEGHKKEEQTDLSGNEVNGNR